MNSIEQKLKRYSQIESKRLLLRPFTLDDVDDVYLYASDDEVTRYMIWDSHQDIDETKRVVEKFYMPRLGVFAIELKEERKCIGCIDLRLEPKHDKAEVGYVLNRNYWNKGYMTEALKRLIDHALSKLGLNRIEAVHDIRNIASGKVMEKSGMRYEGIGRQEVKVKGNYIDRARYAILREDWIKLKENSE